jgi:hypothetical protein
MGMLERIKKRQIEGFKKFVVNMETTESQTRGQIFMAGGLEDPLYMSYVMKNIRTFEDLLTLDGDEIDTVLTQQKRLLGLFAKCFHGTPDDKVMALESLIPGSSAASRTSSPTSRRSRRRSGMESVASS